MRLLLQPKTMPGAITIKRIQKPRNRGRSTLEPIRESDLIFRALMQCLDFYRAFLAKRLPARIRRRIDLSKLRALKTNRIGRGLGERIVDCVFLVPLKTGDGFFLIHVERWSRSKKDAVEIVLDYQIQLLKEARRQYPGQKIFIHTLVVHNGRTPFRHDTDMFPRGTVAERRMAHRSLGSLFVILSVAAATRRIPLCFDRWGDPSSLRSSG
ncbi:MAG: Rpn family recombination-promoting nuclease/putative transposase [Myxococcota bacterium]